MSNQDIDVAMDKFRRSVLEAVSAFEVETGLNVHDCSISSVLSLTLESKDGVVIDRNVEVRGKNPVSGMGFSFNLGKSRQPLNPYVRKDHRCNEPKTLFRAFEFGFLRKGFLKGGLVNNESRKTK